MCDQVDDRTEPTSPAVLQDPAAARGPDLRRPPEKACFTLI